MKERKFIIVNDETGEVMGDLAPQVRRSKPVPSIVLLALLLLTAAFAAKEHARAEDAVDVAREYRDLYETAAVIIESDTADLTPNRSSAEILAKYGLDENGRKIDEKFQQYLWQARSSDVSDLSKREAEIDKRLAEIE